MKQLVSRHPRSTGSTSLVCPLGASAAAGAGAVAGSRYDVLVKHAMQAVAGSPA